MPALLKVPSVLGSFTKQEHNQKTAADNAKQADSNCNRGTVLQIVGELPIADIHAAKPAMANKNAKNIRAIYLRFM